MEAILNEHGYRYSSYSVEINNVCAKFWERRKGRYCEGCMIHSECNQYCGLSHNIPASKEELLPTIKQARETMHLAAVKYLSKD